MKTIQLTLYLERTNLPKVYLKECITQINLLQVFQRYQPGTSPMLTEVRIQARVGWHFISPIAKGRIFLLLWITSEQLLKTIKAGTAATTDCKASLFPPYQVIHLLKYPSFHHPNFFNRFVLQEVLISAGVAANVPRCSQG